MSKTETGWLRQRQDVHDRKRKYKTGLRSKRRHRKKKIHAVGYMEGFIGKVRMLREDKIMNRWEEI
jgi:hypothetical protein